MRQMQCRTAFAEDLAPATNNRQIASTYISAKTTKHLIKITPLKKSRSQEKPTHDCIYMSLMEL